MEEAETHSRVVAAEAPTDRLHQPRNLFIVVCARLLVSRPLAASAALARLRARRVGAAAGAGAMRGRGLDVHVGRRKVAVVHDSENLRI